MKRTYKIFAAVVFSLATAGLAQASTEPGQRYFLQTGSDLERVCANPVNAKAIDTVERERLLVCGSYIQGFLGHYGLSRSESAKSSFCLPPSGVSGEQVRVLFLALLQQKPQIRDLPASVDLATSLAWGYSCNPRQDDTGGAASRSSNR